jgi:hypothetical protein
MKDDLKINRTLISQSLSIKERSPWRGNIQQPHGAARETRRTAPRWRQSRSVPFDKIRDNYLKDGAIDYVAKSSTQFWFKPARHNLG